MLVTHGSDGYFLTPQGTDLVRRVSELGSFATKWAANQSKKISQAK